MTEAVLGLKVESSQVAKAADDLDKLTAAATKAERKAIDWGDRTEVAAKKVEKASSSTTQLDKSLKQVEKGAGQAAQKLDVVGIVVDELTKGLMSTVGPAALAGAAFTAAAGLATAAFQSLRPKVKTADSLLAEHEANIKRLGDAWQEAGNKSRKYASDSASVVNSLNAKNQEDAINLLKEGTLKLIGQLDASLVSFNERGRFGGFAEPIKKLIDEYKNSIPDLIDFRKEINAIGDADPKLSEKRFQILALSDALSEFAASIPGLGEKAKELTDITENFNRKLLEVDSGPIREELQKIFDKAAEGKKGIGDILIEIAKLEQANPAFSGIIAGFKGLIEQAAATGDALDRIGAKYFANAGGSPNGRGSLPVGILPDTVDTVPERAPNREDVGAARDKRLASAARRANPYRDILKSADDRIKQMRLELEMMGQVGVKADTLRNYQELLSRATDRGRKIGEKQKQELHDRAEEMAKVEDATKKAALAQDLLFERAQLGRSSTDQAIADILRSAGLPIDFGSYEAGLIRTNEQLRIAKDLSQDFAQGFISDILSGKSAMESLSNALGRVADKLIEMATDDLFAKAFGGASDSGGGLFGFLGNLLGGGLGGGGISLPASAPIPTARPFAKGAAFENGIEGFSNSIVNKPTAFMFAKGAGIMGEAGPEAIMPLKRDSQGRLGVAANQNGGAVVQIIDQRTGGTIEREDATGPNGEQTVRLIVKDEIRAYDAGSFNRHVSNHNQAKKRIRGYA